MIVFHYVKYKNLLASGNYWTTIRLDDKKNTIIIGQNGSGKSTLLDALCLGLFGKGFRNINKPLFVNSINEKDCLIEISFTTGGKDYKIIRGIKPNVFQIFQDEVLLNQEASVRDYQEILERSILKFNFKSFTQIVILGSASFVPFMQLSAADRRIIIEDLLDIQIFSVMNSTLKDKISVNKTLISDKKNRADMIGQKYDLEKKHLDSQKVNNEDKIVEYENDLKKTQEIIDSLSIEINELISKSNDIQEELKPKIETEAIIKRLNKIEATVEGKISGFKKDLKFFNINNSCPTCEQVIDSEFKNNKIELINKEVLTMDDGLVKLRDKLKQEQDKLNTFLLRQKELYNLQLIISSHNSSIRENSKYIDKLNIQINKLKESISTNEYTDTNLISIKTELDGVKEELKEHIEDRAYYDISTLLLKDTGIKAQVIKQYLPIINKLINKYLTTFDFFVNFNLDESFKETIKSRHRDDFTYNNFSEGEKTRINLSILLAWREIAKMKNSAHTNLLILDEIFDSSLDDIGIDYLLSILHSMEDININVISHKGDVLYDKFDAILQFEKTKNFSKMKTL